MRDKKKVLLVCSPYYKDVTKNLIDGASKILKSNSIEYKILYVPDSLSSFREIKVFDAQSDEWGFKTTISMSKLINL